jgi:hypothetical protein
MVASVNPAGDGHVSFPEAVALRPKMYTMEGTFQEVVAYLEGYFSGASKSPSGLKVAQDWWAFVEKIALRTGDKEHTFAALMKEAGSSEHALQLLAQLAAVHFR